MELKTDKRFIVAQSLKAIVGYAIGVSFILFFLDLEQPYEVIAICMFVGILLFLYLFPKNISVNDGTISFRKDNSRKNIDLNLADIAEVESECKYYNTIILTTKSGKKYKLHPEDAQTLEKAIQSGK